VDGGGAVAGRCRLVDTQDLFGKIDADGLVGAGADRFALGLETDVSDASPAFQDDGRSALAPRVAAYEKSLIAQAIAARGGNLKSVYENLGISRKTLYEKMQKYELHRHMTEM